MRMSSSSCLKHNLVIAEAGCDWTSESTYETCIEHIKGRERLWRLNNTDFSSSTVTNTCTPERIAPITMTIQPRAFIKIICSMLQDNLLGPWELSTSYPFSNEATASAWDQYIKYLQVLPEMHVTSNVFKSSLQMWKANYNKNRRCKQLCRTTNHASVLHWRLQDFHFMNRPARWA